MQSVDRHQWEEPSWEKSGGALCMVGMAENILTLSSKQSSQQFVYEDFNVSAGSPLKKKMSGVADPRFRRVVPAGMTDEIAQEARKVSESLARAAAGVDVDDKPPVTDLHTFAKGSRIPTFFPKKHMVNPSESQSPVRCVEEKKDDRSETAAPKTCRIPNCEVFNGYSPEESAELETLSKKLGRPRRSKTAKIHPPPQQAKKSVSDCTLLTKNTSLGEEDAGSEYNKLQSFTSATRLSKVNNWIKEYKPVPEKRRSVITVIGQTQGKSFSTVLNEINQRRKLAKELDKHALCETILQTSEKDKEKDLKNLIAKVDFVSPDGKIIYTARKVYGFRDSSTLDSLLSSKGEEFLINNTEPLKSGTMPFKLNDQIPERDVPANQARKRKSKRGTKKTECRKLDFKGATQLFLTYVQNRTVISVAIMVCAVVIAVLLFICKQRRIMSYLNLGKPKPRSWYDEFF